MTSPAIAGIAARNLWLRGHKVMLDRDLADGTGAQGKEAYLCGSPGFLKSVNEVLMKKGFNKETQIFYDEF